MPNRDGTGPQGNGPKTGRGTGNCVTPNDSEDVKQEDKQSNEDCGQGRGLKPCGQNNNSDNSEDK